MPRMRVEVHISVTLSHGRAATDVPLEEVSEDETLGSGAILRLRWSPSDNRRGWSFRSRNRIPGRPCGVGLTLVGAVQATWLEVPSYALEPGAKPLVPLIPLSAPELAVPLCTLPNVEYSSNGSAVLTTPMICGRRYPRDFRFWH